ncbi:MAG TPA: DUF1844 domain-containing protein [Phototrophicaceae bacterium]|jgi:hypothetical protein|nr:DUF1844 domain-containing protein [Phototrophicaceae bacterium]
MADEESKQAGKGFTVQDRRRFSPDTGEAREEAPEQSEAQPKSSEERREASGATSSETLPEINFSTFVIGLSTQALMHLGEIANPVSGDVEIDVPTAKQMIDILGLLKDKTRGNLNASEDRLMEDILFDLRMKYVEAVKKR